MTLHAMFSEVEFEIQSMAWPTVNGKAPAVMPVVELLRDLRTEVMSRIDSDAAQGPGTPDDVITTAQVQFRELFERGALSQTLTDSLCAQLAAMRSQIHNNANHIDVDDAPCYND